MSFRARLFVSTIVSVLVVLAIVMATAWVRVLEVEGSRLNAGLCSEAIRLTRRDITSQELVSLEADIARKLHLGARSYEIGRAHV